MISYSEMPRRPNDQARGGIRRARPLGIVLVLASIGCRQIVGFADEPGPAGLAADAGVEADAGAEADTGIEADAGGEAEASVFMSANGPWRFANSSCGACIDQSCASEEHACATDPSCSAFEACVASCGLGDKECAGHCWARVPSSSRSPQTWSLNHCEAAACRDACGLWVTAGGQTCGSWLMPTDCVTCCCKELDACDNDPECVRQSACDEQCAWRKDGQPCRQACTGQAAFNPKVVPLTDCETGRCASACLTQDWTCLGKVQWPKASSRTLTLALMMSDFIDSRIPLVGFNVRGCITGDKSCTMPLAEGTTNDAGFVALELVTNGVTNSVSAYFEVTGPPGSGYQPYIFYVPEFYMTQSFAAAGISVIGRSVVEATLGPDPALGHVLFGVINCNPFGSFGNGGSSAPNVQVTASPAGPSTRTYYLAGLSPSTTAIATDDSGDGIIMNLPPGEVTLEVRRADTKELIGSRTVWVRPDTVTELTLTPTPTPTP